MSERNTRSDETKNDDPNSDKVVYLGEERRETEDFEYYFNQQFDADPVYLEPGQNKCIDNSSKVIVANVGSGVTVLMHDEYLKIGAMGYIMMPEQLFSIFPYFEEADPDLLCKALQPLENCINDMKRAGAGKNRIKVRLIGGSDMPRDKNDAGTKNYVFAREFVTRKGLAVTNEELGGKYVRRVYFFPTTGRAVRLMLRRDSDFKMMKQIEDKYLQTY